MEQETGAALTLVTVYDEINGNGCNRNRTNIYLI